MAEQGKPDEQLFGLLSNLLQQPLDPQGPKEGGRPLNKDMKFRISPLLPKLSVGPGDRVEALTNQEEIELRAKIEALGLEVTKVPSKSRQPLDELEIAKELDKLSAKLDDVDEMISSSMAADPEVESLLSSTADVWMPVITATSDERRQFTAAVGNGDDNFEKSISK